MKADIKSGKEVLDEFFTTLLADEKLDVDTVKVLVDLYGAGKLSDTNIKNKLAELREATGD